MNSVRTYFVDEIIDLQPVGRLRVPVFPAHFARPYAVMVGRYEDAFALVQ